MQTEKFNLELITPCFCGGAEPEKQAEIRAPSVRGQLRWWFRILGGFKSLQPMRVGEQEAMIFGSTAGDEGEAGRLIVRVRTATPKSMPVNADDLNAGMNTPLGYALFPLRPVGEGSGRGKIAETTGFEVSVLWRGGASLWGSVRALLAVWAHVGSLGFRSRRAFGSVQLKSPELGLAEALREFASPSGILLTQLEMPPSNNWRATSARLLEWYRSWRQHGQMSRRWDRNQGRWLPIQQAQQDQNRAKPGFRYARRDHNEGLDVQGTGAPTADPEKPAGQQGETFRSALGLPIIQFFSSLGDNGGPLQRPQATVNWEFSAGQQKGRFASPVLLRPHRDAQGNWHALVIFVDAHRWPDDPATRKPKQVYLNGQARDVSLELYEAMKQDKALKPFTG